MMRILQWLHRWTSLIIIIQVMLWIITGFYFSLSGHHAMSGHHYHKMDHSHTAVSASQGVDWSQLTTQFNGIIDVQLRTVGGVAQYQISHADGISYVNAATGKAWETSPNMATELALATYAGPGEFDEIVELPAGSDEVLGWNEPGYRVNMQDDLNTRIYVDAASGNVVEHRNTPWVLADWAFKLHFMDYSGGRNFNHLLIVSAGILTLWFTLSGLILLGRNVVRGDMNPRRKPTYLEVFQAEHKPIASACGGGGTCGLCKVTFSGEVPAPTASDRAMLSAAELSSGTRLSCQHRVKAGVEAELAASELRQVKLKLVHNQVLTPSIHELTFIPQTDMPFDYEAGQFMQFIVPSPSGSASVMLRRNYSFASAPGTPELTFTVRKMPAPNSSCKPGVGSTYLCGLQVGESIDAIGPMGDFVLNRDNGNRRAQVFIGGGAGIAPLRALMQAELESSQPPRSMQFFYGARNQAELCYYQEFIQLQAQQKMHYLPVLSEQDEHWRGLTGFVHEIARTWLQTQDVQAVDVYVCGPPAMLAATQAMLRDVGVPAERIRYDDFGI